MMYHVYIVSIKAVPDELGPSAVVPCASWSASITYQHCHPYKYDCAADLVVSALSGRTGNGIGCAACLAKRLEC